MTIIVTADGFISQNDLRFRCALGRQGIGWKHCEGDGLTPIGDFYLGRLFWRADRIEQPITQLPCVKIAENMGWCDDPDHADYNTLITLPHTARHEKLWRDEAVYDVIIEILFNCKPIQKGRGSAIFMHVAQSNYGSTEGCVALALPDLLTLARSCNTRTKLNIQKQHTIFEDRP